MKVTPSKPLIFRCFRNSSAIRNAISLGGDSDTLGCIASGIAYAFYRKIPDYIKRGVREKLPEEFLDIIDPFEKNFIIEYNK